MKKIDPDHLIELHAEPRRNGSAARDESRRGMLSPLLASVLQECRRELALGSSGGNDGGSVDSAEFEPTIGRVCERLGFEISPYERNELLAHLEREQKPFGILQELVDDVQVSDIIVSCYSKITVQQGRRNFGTALSFPNAEAYEVFVERLLQRAGSTYSTKKPVADGMIGSHARIHAVHGCLCDEGPYLTIRLDRFSSVGVRDLVECGLTPAAVLGYLERVIRAGHTVMIVGEVGTGKTTLARALAASIPAEEAILVIEDTPEIRLEHPNVRYLTTREENTDGAGRISPSQCIRAGMRMAMNRIIFGEIRDAEAAEAFVDVCASGHPGLSTVHARNGAEAISRLELFLGRAQKGAQRNVLSEQVANAVQVIVSVNLCPETGKRRIIEVKELGSAADGPVRQREVFRYQPVKGLPSWRVPTRVSAFREALESGENPIVLSELPATLDLAIEVLYREAAFRRTG